MKRFACDLLGIKDISPETLNLRKLYTKETIATEPILIIISPGADPSAELRDLAAEITGKDRYFEVNKGKAIVRMSYFLSCSFHLKVAMGQGQMEITLDLLKTCSTDGSWLCLKNLHLVTPWLSTLEKVLGNGLVSRLPSALSRLSNLGIERIEATQRLSSLVNIGEPSEVSHHTPSVEH